MQDVLWRPTTAAAALEYLTEQAPGLIQRCVADLLLDAACVMRCGSGWESTEKHLLSLARIMSCQLCAGLRAGNRQARQPFLGCSLRVCGVSLTRSDIGRSRDYPNLTMTLAQASRLRLRRDAGQDCASQLAAWAVLDRCLASGVAQFREALALEMVMQRFVLDAGSSAVRDSPACEAHLGPGASFLR